MDKYKSIDEKIGVGYKFLKSSQATKGCDVLLDAWEDIKAVMAEDMVEDLSVLEGKYKWTEFIMNYVQDLEQELHNAGVDDSQYI